MHLALTSFQVLEKSSLGSVRQQCASASAQKQARLCNRCGPSSHLSRTSTPTWTKKFAEALYVVESALCGPFRSAKQPESVLKFNRSGDVVPQDGAWGSGDHYALFRITEDVQKRAPSQQQVEGKFMP